MLLGMTSLADVPVKVCPHRSLNSCKGVVRSRDLARCTKEEIISELKSQGVTDAVIISVKNGYERRIINAVILSFSTPQPPQHVTVGYLRIPVGLHSKSTEMLSVSEIRTRQVTLQGTADLCSLW